MAKLIFRRTHKTLLFSRKVSTRFHDPSIKTAGIIVIGDEILKGEVLDTNSNCMAAGLHKLGVKVKKISVVGDVLDEISSEVRDFSKRYSYVLTSGGIGPTHDDVTFEAVAKAFNEKTVMNPELVKICTEFYENSDPHSPGMKLARIPKSAKLTYSGDQRTSIKTNYPNVSVQNVYMFPGIPQLFQKSFNALASSLFQSANKFYTRKIYLNITEDKIAQTLSIIVKEFPNVIIGSYPKLFHSDYKVKIIIESTEEQSTAGAYNKLLEMVPIAVIVQVQD